MKKITMIATVASLLLFVGCVDTSTGESTKKGLAEASGNVVDATKKVVTKAAEATKEKVTKVAEKTKEVAKEVVTATKEKAAEVVETTKEKVTEVVEATKEVATEVVEKATEKVADIVAPAAGDATAGDATAGAALYPKCAGCHGKDGKTKALGKSGPIAGQDATVGVEALKGYKAGTLNKNGMGALMKGQVASMSDADMANVSAYIATLK